MPQTDRHAPWVDDHLKDEARPSEPPPVHRDRLDALLDRRASLARLLTAATYPASRAELLAVADAALADQAVLDALAALPPAERYGAFGEVWAALGGPDVDAVVDDLVEPGSRPSSGRAHPAPASSGGARSATAARPPVRRFGFAFEPLLAPFALAVGVAGRTAWVELDTDARTLEIRFGPWVLRSGLDNVAGAEVTGPYRLLKVVGPPHLSLADRGVTFATNRRRGVCIRFREPVAGLLPGRRLPHPAATVTVAEPERLVAALSSS